MRGKEIFQLKGNSISRGLIPLEKLFNLDDVERETHLVPNCKDIEEVNIRTKEQPNIIEIARTLSHEAKQRYISLMK